MGTGSIIVCVVLAYGIGVVCGMAFLDGKLRLTRQLLRETRDEVRAANQKLREEQARLEEVNRRFARGVIEQLRDRSDER